MVKLSIASLSVFFFFISTAQARTACDFKPKTLLRLGIRLEHPCEQIKEGDSLGGASIKLGSGADANNDQATLLIAAQDVSGFSLSNLDIKYKPFPATPVNLPVIVMPALPASLSPVSLNLVDVTDELFPLGIFDGELPRTQDLTLSLAYPDGFQQNMVRLGRELGQLQSLSIVSNGRFCLPLDGYSKVSQLLIEADSVCPLTSLQEFTSLSEVNLNLDKMNTVELNLLAGSQKTLKILSLKNLKQLAFGQLVFPLLEEVYFQDFKGTDLPLDWRKFSPSLQKFSIWDARNLVHNPLDTIDFPESLKEVLLLRTSIDSWQGSKTYPHLAQINISYNHLLDVPDAPCLLYPELKYLGLLENSFSRFKSNLFTGCRSNPYFDFNQAKLELNQEMLRDVIASKKQIFLNPLSAENLTLEDEVFPYLGWSWSSGEIQENADNVDLTDIKVIGPLCRNTSLVTRNAYPRFILAHLGLSEFPLCLKDIGVSDLLDLSRNDIHSIPSRALDGSSVKRIFLVGNPVESVATQAFYGLKNLEFISLSLKKNGAKASLDFSGSPVLKRILFEVPDDFILDPEMFTAAHHLVTLEVHGGKLANPSVQKKLKSLNLGYFQIP